MMLLVVLFIAVATSTASATCVAPGAAGTTGAAGDYQSAVNAFVQGGCFLKEWPSDAAAHLTGNVVNAITYSVHDQIRVYYSPAMLAWMQKNRPDGTTVPAQGTPIPDGAAMVAAIYPVSATSPLVATGYLVMIRKAGGRSTDPASGWFFSQVVLDQANYGGTRVAVSMGDYSLGLCVGSEEHTSELQSQR